jgi:LPS-assembly lipoprotein
MWWPSRTTDDKPPTTAGASCSVVRRAPSVLWRLPAVICLSALAAGCFQPLYGERTLTGEPSLRAALRGIDVAQIDAPGGSALARIAVEVRNALLFDLTGGDSQTPPTHRLVIVLQTSTSSIIVDPSTARPEFEITALNANYRLINVATNKLVMDGAASARVSYDIPGQEQRFLMLRGQRDAQSRAAKVIAEQIRNRLASFLVAGT